MIPWIQQEGNCITKKSSNTSIESSLLKKFIESGNFVLPEIANKTPEMELFEAFVNSDLPVAKLKEIGG